MLSPDSLLPLGWLVRHGDLDLLRIQVAAPFVSLDELDGADMTPLMWAVKSARLDLLHCLVCRGAPLNQQNAEGWSAVSFAIKEGRSQSCAYLLDCGALAHFPAHLTLFDVCRTHLHLPTLDECAVHSLFDPQQEALLLSRYGRSLPKFWALKERDLLWDLTDTA